MAETLMSDIPQPHWKIVRGLEDQLSQALRELGEANALAARRLEGNALLLMWKNRAEAARDAALRSTAELRGALEQIAGQHKLSELSEAGEDCEGDFEGAYDMIIDVARTALASSSTKGEG